MMINDKDLIKIHPQLIDPEKDSILFTLALIRNDISDLLYLQHLSMDDLKNITNHSEVSAETGQASGRRIYIIRLFLSHFYSILEFLEEKDANINSNISIRLSLLKLKKSLKMKNNWDQFMKLARNKEVRDLTKFKGRELLLMKFVKLANVSRNDLTYHYYGTSKHIKKGYNLAFIKDGQKEGGNSDFAYVTEMSTTNVQKDRSYYIDLSTKVYLENATDLDCDLVKFVETGGFVELMADLHLIINSILKDYHLGLAKEKINF